MITKLRHAGALLTLLAALIAIPALTAAPAHAATAAPAVTSSTLGDRVLNTAETKA